MVPGIGALLGLHRGFLDRLENFDARSLAERVSRVYGDRRSRVAGFV
jgi:hypothetical protein